MPRAARVTTPLGAALHRLGITQAEAARRLGITQGAVGDLVTGRRRATLDRLHAAAVALDLDPHELDARLAPRPPA